MSKSLSGFAGLHEIQVDLTSFSRSPKIRVDLMGHAEFVKPITDLDFSFFKPGQSLESPGSTNLTEFNNYNYIKLVMIKTKNKNKERKGKKKKKKKKKKNGKEKEKLR